MISLRRPFLPTLRAALRRRSTSASVRYSRERTSACLWRLGNASFGTSFSSTSNFPVFDGWHPTAEGAQHEQRRQRVYHTFLKKAQNRKVSVRRLPYPGRLDPCAAYRRDTTCPRHRVPKEG